MPAEDLDIWPITVGIEKEEEQWRGGEWSMEKEGLRRFMIKRTI